MLVVFGGGSDIARAVKELYPDTRLVPKSECDVRDHYHYRYIPYWIISEFINPGDDVLNCAGISLVGDVKNSYFDWIDEIETNLIGSYNVARAAVEKNAAAMVFIASVAGLYGKPNHSGYCASKAGVISLVQSLAMEGYNAYCISPGRVDTKMRERDYPGEDRRTRLTTKQVAREILKCVGGKYRPGDNVIIRKIGHKTYHKIDRGEPWKTYLNVKPS